MSILSWDKPEKIMSTEEWQSISADSAPAGVYTPNMSREDQRKWKAKVVGVKTDHPQVEIRRNSIVLIVSLNGYRYKQYKPESTRKTNVHLSSSGAQQMSFSEFDNMYHAVQEAREYLEAINGIL